MGMEDDVREFHRRFGWPDGDGPPALPAPDVARFRVAFLREEADELEGALAGGDLVGAVDALVDLAYVALGTALHLGVGPGRWRACWAAVHAANMAKVAVASASESRRGHAMDARKPPGWVGPEAAIAEVLKESP